jgi:hypothetical protein
MASLVGLITKGTMRSKQEIETDIEKIADQSHGATCGMRLHSASECTCGKLDRLSELEEELKNVDVDPDDLVEHAERWDNGG